MTNHRPWPRERGGATVPENHVPVGLLDVVVVSYWSSLQLTGLLAGLPRDCTVTVVDNAEDVDRDTRQVCDDHGARVAHLPLGRNTGFGYACNVGARNGNAPFILFVNPDCRVDEHVIGTLLATMANKPTVAASAPLLTADDSRSQIFGGAAPRLRTALGYLTLPDRLLGRWCIWARTTRSRTPVRVEWLSGACLVVRREAFDAVNGFREDLFMYNEDIDLCVGLRRDGWTVILDPNVTARHAGGRSSRLDVDIAGLWSRSTLRYLGVAERSFRSVLIAVLLLGGMCRRHVVAVLLMRARRTGGSHHGATFARQFAAELFKMLRNITRHPATSPPQRAESSPLRATGHAPTTGPVGDPVGTHVSMACGGSQSAPGKPRVKGASAAHTARAPHRGTEKD
jgi:N-acetylglucosaminyl-diphospho-decaprenol L-rhamnosyltransferase